MSKGTLLLGFPQGSENRYSLGGNSNAVPGATDFRVEGRANNEVVNWEVQSIDTTAAGEVLFGLGNDCAFQSFVVPASVDKITMVAVTSGNDNIPSACAWHGNSRIRFYNKVTPYPSFDINVPTEKGGVCDYEQSPFYFPSLSSVRWPLAGGEYIQFSGFGANSFNTLVFFLPTATNPWAVDDEFWVYPQYFDSQLEALTNNWNDPTIQAALEAKYGAETMAVYRQFF